MQNKLHNIKVYKFITFISIVIILMFCAYIPIKHANDIKSFLYKSRYNQIQYLNNQSNIIPEIINIIKGHIIHNEKALKDIVYINVLTKTKNNSIKEIYDNQLKIFAITDELIKNASKNSLLINNKKFNETKENFDKIYTTAKKQYELCKINTNQLKKYLQLPIYKDLIDTTNINDIICID